MQIIFRYDSQEGIQIPENLLEYANINKNITVIGVIKIELWDEKALNDYEKSKSNFTDDDLIFNDLANQINFLIDEASLPVLVDEVIENLAIKKMVFTLIVLSDLLDTFVNPKENQRALIGFDLDPYTSEKSKEKLRVCEKQNFSLYHKSYCEFPEYMN